MGTLRQLHFEGQPNAGAFTKTSSDDFGDDAINFQSITSMTGTFSNATLAVAHGTMGLSLTGGTTNPSYYGFGWITTWNATTFRLQAYVTFTDFPDTGGIGVIRLVDAANATIGELDLNTSGQLYTQYPGTTTAIKTTALSLNTKYRIDGLFKIATSGGIWQWSVSALDSTSPISTIGGTSVNSGSKAIGGVYFGKISSSVPLGTMYWDDVRAEDAQTAYFAPWAAPANKPPTLSTPTSVTGTLGQPVSVTATANDPDGTINTYAWSWVNWPLSLGGAAGSGGGTVLSGATTATATFTPTTAGRYTVSCVVTDNSGATSSTSFTDVYIPATNVTVCAEGENSGAFTGAYSDIADNSDTTYVQTTGSGTNTFQLEPVSTGSGAATLTIRAAYVDAGATLTVTLKQSDGKQIAQWQLLNLTATPTNYTLPLTTAQIASITLPNNLQVTFS